jgi:hypothetical protein
LDKIKKNYFFKYLKTLFCSVIGLICVTGKHIAILFILVMTAFRSLRHEVVEKEKLLKNEKKGNY